MNFQTYITVAFIVLTCNAARITERCNEPDDYLKIVRGRRSAVTDDAETEAKCPKNYEILNCECESFESDPVGCDGSTIRSVADGERCIAYNGAKGKGVVAKVTCGKTMFTCISDHKEAPQIKCPRNYKLLSCNLHAYKFHKYAGSRKYPQAKKQGGLCKATKDCIECRLTARCIRAYDFYNKKDD